MHARFVALILGALMAGAIAMPAAGALPATGAGSLDPTFGIDGKISLDVLVGSNRDGIGSGVVQPDGKLVASGFVQRGGSNDISILATRFLDNGAPDPAFGNGGTIIHAIDESAYADWFGPALGADGRIFIVGAAKSGGVYRCIVLALQPNGALDTAFGVGGVFRGPASATGSTECINIAVQDDGKLVVLGNADSFKTNFVLRLTSGGALDPTFGVQGVATLPGGTTNFVYGLGVAPSGAIYLAGSPANGSSPGYVYRLTGAGVLDASFAGGGTYTTTATNVFFHDVQPLPDGSVLASGYRGGKHYVLKLGAAGVPAPDFGAAGVTEITLGTGYSAVALAVQRDGKILVGIRLRTAAGPWRFAVARLTANGALDPGYGTGGIAQISFGFQGEVLYGISQGPDGKLWLFGRADLSDTDSAVAIARLLPDEITTTVTEFYNDTLNHFFITADPNEAAAIDGGAAGPGWSRTGQTFRSGGPNKVCRFYGNPDPNPATGMRWGPNSHFYTIEAAECAAVKLDPGWRFESHDFNAWPMPGGGCPAGTVAVKRVYNNRFAQNDSNHRYMTDEAIYQQMLGRGWSGEGVVMCAVAGGGPG